MHGTRDEAKALDSEVQYAFHWAAIFVRKVDFIDSVKHGGEFCHLSLYRKPEQEFHYSSPTKLLCEGDCVLKGANSTIGFVEGLSFPIPQQTLELFPFFLPKFSYTACRAPFGNGDVPVAGTPLDTTNKIRSFCNTIKAVGSSKNGDRKNTFQDNRFFSTLLTKPKKLAKSGHCFLSLLSLD